MLRSKSGRSKFSSSSYITVSFHCRRCCYSAENLPCRSAQVVHNTDLHGLCAHKLEGGFGCALVSFRRLVYAVGEGGTMKSTVLLIGVLAIGCGTSNQDPGPDYVAGFDPGAVPDGYTRF